MKNYKIALLAGDGIGPEIMAEAVKIFRLVEERNDVTFTLIEADFGASCLFRMRRSVSRADQEDL
jgi:3-isopropylmalate dehydrogenase